MALGISMFQVAPIWRDRFKVLAVWGTNDQVTPFSGSNRLLEVMPSTELKIIEGGTHNITFVQPTKIGKMIVSFLEGK